MIGGVVVVVVVVFFRSRKRGFWGLKILTTYLIFLGLWAHQLPQVLWVQQMAP